VRTIVGLYDKFEDTQQVVRELTDAGFDKNNINLIAHDNNGKLSKQAGSGEKQDLKNGAVAGAAVGGIGGLLVGLGALMIPGVGPVLAAGPIAAALAGAGVGAAGGALVGALIDLGIPEEQSHRYAEGVRRGGTLVTVQTDDQRANDALQIMNRHNPTDINRRSDMWQQDQWSGFDANAQPMTDEQLTMERSRYQEEIPTTGGDMTLPVIEEDVQVGKQEVDRGGVRIHSFETQRPVEQDVSLRKEKVNVDRKPVDRPATDADMNSFRDSIYEVKETEEVPVVNKNARVVEEVHVNKDVSQETETVRDTARRTDVEVEQLGQDWQKNQSMYQEHFRSHFGQRGQEFSFYLPAYQYGYDLRSNPNYRGKGWNAVEASARKDWERSGHTGRWEDFRDAIRYGFDGR
jgi:uncharacterized protein (TIGR02271 family)